MEQSPEHQPAVSRETRLRLRLYGGVQGVGFRYFTATAARRLGLAGWVCNLPDGAVELEAAGRPDALDALRSEVHVGPPHATVGNVEERPASGDPLPRPFAILRSPPG